MQSYCPFNFSYFLTLNDKIALGCQNNGGIRADLRRLPILACEQLLDGKSEQLTAKLLEMALEGNLQAMRMCLDRTVPPRKERSINLDLRPITCLQDRMLQFEDLTSAVAEGRITPSEGESISNILISQAKTLQVVEFARRLPQIDDKEYKFKGSMEELLAHYHRLVSEKPEGSDAAANPSGEPKESPDA